MLNNGIFFSLIISAVSTGLIYLLTNKDYKEDTKYDNKDLLKIFSIIFLICFSINYFKNKSLDPIKDTPSMRSGESLLTHSSRPPF